MPSWITSHPQFAIIEACSRSKSRHEKRWAAKVLAQFETQQTQYVGEHEDLCWYFLTFCCGYGYGYKTHGGDFVWITNRRLTPKLVAQQLGLTAIERPYRSLNIAIPNQTMAACVDVDINSRYHPANDGEGIEPVKNALAEIGLIKALEFQSSFSTGMHLWYPLPAATKSWELANAMEDACRAKNLEIKDGILELRPNRRNFDSNFKLIRAPLSGDGNALWLGDIGGLEESDVVIFRHFFNSAANSNSLMPLQYKPAIIASSSSNTRAPVSNKKSLNYYQSVLAGGFSSSEQTQQIQFAALIIARMVEGVDSVAALRARLIELVTSAPGYKQHCGHREQIENGSYWSNSTLLATLQFSESDYNKSWRKTCNDRKALNASQKAQEAIFSALADGMLYSSQNAAVEALRANYQAPGRRWWFKPANAKHKKMLDRLIDKKKQVS